jgi:ATP-binding cassette subfamily C protein
MPDCSEEDIWKALESSNAKDFVKALPDGLDTTMGDRGANLSGGQRQRIALARALIKKPLILILDEATSSLDNDSEKYIQQSINGLSKNITLITIAHRLSTIKNANKIFVLDQGEVLEHGSYQELADNKKSKFSEMLSQF